MKMFPITGRRVVGGDSTFMRVQIRRLWWKQEYEEWRFGLPYIAGNAITGWTTLIRPW